MRSVNASVRKLRYILFLVTAALLINDDLISINVSVRKLKALQTDVTTKLNDINSTITTSCASVPGGCSVDTSSLSFNPDFSGVSIWHMLVYVKAAGLFDLVPFHSGQVRNFYLLILRQVER